MSPVDVERAFLEEGYATAWELMADSSRTPVPLGEGVATSEWSRAVGWAYETWSSWVEHLPVTLRTPVTMRALTVRDTWPVSLRGEGAAVALIALAQRNFPYEARALADRWTARAGELVG